MVQRRETLDQEREFSSDTSLVHRLAVERVIRAMRDRLNEPLMLQDLADIAYLSPNHFHRIFHPFSRTVELL